MAYHHFKMDTFRSALQLVHKNCYFCSVDLKDAFYSIKIHEADSKYLRFIWDDQLYEFTCLVMGLSEAPRKFTKIVKVLLSELRKLGINIVAFIDDTLIVDETKIECNKAAATTVTQFDGKGLTIHPAKSVLDATQTIDYLGFTISSVTMTARIFSRSPARTDRSASSAC